MVALDTRLVEAGWEVERTEHGTLVAETMGEQYRIYPTGEINGDGRIRDPLANIVAQYWDKFSSELPAWQSTLQARWLNGARLPATCPAEESFSSRGCRSPYADRPRTHHSDGSTQTVPYRPQWRRLRADHSLSPLAPFHVHGLDCSHRRRRDRGLPGTTRSVLAGRTAGKAIKQRDSYGQAYRATLSPRARHYPPNQARLATNTVSSSGCGREPVPTELHRIR